LKVGKGCPLYLYLLRATVVVRGAILISEQVTIAGPFPKIKNVVVEVNATKRPVKYDPFYLQQHDQAASWPVLQGSRTTLLTTFLPPKCLMAGSADYVTQYDRHEFAVMPASLLKEVLAALDQGRRVAHHLPPVPE
jgi:hypothetical protein